MTEVYKAFSSAVMGVPAYAIANKWKDIVNIKNYAVGKVVSCCIVENGLPPTTVGCIRRCTICLKRFEEALLREKLVSVFEDDFHTVITLQYLPCRDSEANRSPFGIEGNKRLQAATTTYSVTVLNNSPNRCFVEMSSTFEIVRSPNGDEMEEKAMVRAIRYFWQTYLDNLVLALESQVLSEAYPVLSGRIDAEFRESYEVQEDVFCQWAASNSESFPRDSVLENYERCLVQWSRVLQEYRHQKLVAESVKADAEGSKLIAAESARQLADSTARVMEMKKQMEEDKCPYFYRSPVERGEEPPVTSSAARVIDHSHQRQLYQTATTTDPFRGLLQPAARHTPAHRPFFSKNGGQKLPVTEAASKPPAAKAPAQPTGGSPQPFHPALLNRLFTEAGLLDEEAAKGLFELLDVENQQYVSATEMKRILMQMDHRGLYEDRDGTADELELYRAAIKEGYALRYASPETYRAIVAAAHTQAAATAEAEAEEPSAGVESANADQSPATSTGALARMVGKHDARKAAIKDAAMAKLAEDTLKRFAFRTSGQLCFDEFCLALYHLLKS